MQHHGAIPCHPKPCPPCVALPTQDVDRLTNELLVMKGELEAVRGKLDSAVSRRKTLESDLAGTETRAVTL